MIGGKKHRSTRHGGKMLQKEAVKTGAPI